jgi:hypothetical protein
MSVVCEAQGCATRPTFAFPGERARHCVDHREPGMTSTIPRDHRVCEAEGCASRPTFAFPGERARLCVIEVDESQHNTYMCARTCQCPDAWHRHCKCQQARMIELTQLAQRPCVWLRYNPDKYNGPKISAAKRQEDLLRHIKYYQAKETLDKEMEVVYLFYDQ